MRAHAALTLLGLLVLAKPALATDAPGPPNDPESGRDDSAPEGSPASAGDRALAGATAAVPGIVVHGAGHYVAGQGKTGTRRP